MAQNPSSKDNVIKKSDHSAVSSSEEEFVEHYLSQKNRNDVVVSEMLISDQKNTDPVSFIKDDHQDPSALLQQHFKSLVNFLTGEDLSGHALLKAQHIGDPKNDRPSSSTQVIFQHSSSQLQGLSDELEILQASNQKNDDLDTANAMGPQAQATAAVEKSYQNLLDDLHVLLPQQDTLLLMEQLTSATDPQQIHDIIVPLLENESTVKDHDVPDVITTIGSMIQAHHALEKESKMISDLQTDWRDEDQQEWRAITPVSSLNSVQAPQQAVIQDVDPEDWLPENETEWENIPDGFMPLVINDAAEEFEQQEVVQQEAADSTEQPKNTPSSSSQDSDINISGMTVSSLRIFLALGPEDQQIVASDLVKDEEQTPPPKNKLN